MLLSMLPDSIWNSLKRGVLPPMLRPTPKEKDLPQAVVRETRNHSYKLQQPPIGLGGFSNVYAAQLKKRTLLRNRLSISGLRKKLGHREEDPDDFKVGVSAYEYAIKVCELNAENLGKPPEDEYGMPLPMMSAAELNILAEETEILRSLQPSRYVVKLHDAFFLKGAEQFWMVMERLVVDMRSLCTTTMLDDIPNARLCLLKQTLDGLAHIKVSGIVHGDIKPSNILLSSTGYVKICDFGAARKLEEGEKLVVEYTMGSAQYMAPELWIEGYRYDHSVDLFAFGLVVYASFNKGKSALARVRQVEYQRFTKEQWDSWNEGNEEYFGAVMGVNHLSQAERDLLLSKRVLPDFIDKEAVMKSRRARDPQYNEWYEAHADLIEVSRRCVVPLPTNGPNGEVTRTDLLYRAYIDEVQALEYFSNAPNELRSRNCIMRVVQSFLKESADKQEQARKPTL